MTNKAGEQPTITQADRDAAAAYWKVSMIGSSMTQKLYKSGEFDSSLIVQAFARHRTTSLAAQVQQVLALVEAARDAGDVLQSAASPSNLDPQYSDQIAALGERIGYGALMHGASALWRKSLGDLSGSEFAAGPCVSTAASRLARLDDALMPFRGETLPDAPSLAAQDGLVEALEYMLRVFDETNANDYEDVHLMVRQSSKIRSIADCRKILSAIKGDKS